MLARKIAMAAVAPLFLSGCVFDDSEGLSCNAAFFFDMLVIEIDRETWEPGDYSFRISRDPEFVQCSLRVEAGAQTFSTPACLTSASFDGRETQPAAPVEVVSNRVIFNLTSHTRMVQVSIERDRQPLFSETVQPSYARDEPNGPGCGDRFRAHEFVHVP